MKADLHTHTSITDCSYTQEEVIIAAKKNNVTHLAITDHDTTQGLSEAIKLGVKHGVEIIPGIEISAYDYANNKKCHIVGLYVPLNNRKLNSFTSKITESRNKNSQQQVKLLSENGYNIGIEDFKHRGSYSIYKQHIMQALIDKGYAKDIYGDKYQELFKGNGICNLKVEYPDAIAAVQVLKEINAFPVLAHPGVYNNFDIIERLVDVGLQGVEGIYPFCSPAHYQKIKILSDKHNLIITGGTDFHGQYAANSNDKIGDYCVDPAILTKIKKRLE